MRNTLPSLSMCCKNSSVSCSTSMGPSTVKLPSRTHLSSGVPRSTISVSRPIYSGFMALSARAVPMACCVISSRLPRPEIAVTDSSMPQRRAFCPAATIEAASWPLFIFSSTSSQPDSKPMYTIVRPCSRSKRKSSSDLICRLVGEA